LSALDRARAGQILSEAGCGPPLSHAATQAGRQSAAGHGGLQLRSGTHELTGRFIGPFTVTGSVNDNAVQLQLELPQLLGALSLHSTFIDNISRLKPRWAPCLSDAAAARGVATSRGQ